MTTASKLLARIAELEAGNRELVKQVEIDAIIFEEYARLHRLKGTQEGEAKAQRNELNAADCRALLTKVGQP